MIDCMDAHDLLFAITNNGLYMSNEDIRRSLGVDDVELWYTKEQAVDVVSYDDGKTVLTGFKLPHVKCTKDGRTIEGTMPLVKTRKRFDVEPKAFKREALDREEFGRTSIARASKAIKVLRNLDRLHSIRAGAGHHPFVDWRRSVKEWKRIIEEALKQPGTEAVTVLSFQEPEAPIQ